MRTEEYLTVQQVAQLCSVQDQAVYYWITDGRLGSFKFGGRYRIPLSEFEAFKQRSRVTATTPCRTQAGAS